MAFSQLNRYFWLIETIRSAGEITRDEIDRKWSSSIYNEKHESVFPERTFFRCKNSIEAYLGIKIGCKRSRQGGFYYIEQTDFNSRNKQSLLSQFAISQLIDIDHELSDKIIYEPIPEGSEYLTTIVEALRDKRMLLVSHLRFDSTEPPHVFHLAPQCLKVFKQRWYVLGFVEEIDGVHTTPPDEPRIYSLDRVKSIELLDQHFHAPVDFDPSRYFEEFYGVFCGKQYHPEHIRVRVQPLTAKYMRSLPLHHSQQEPEPCVFEWYVAPTLDFIQQLRTYGSEIEVLSPQTLREQFGSEIERLNSIYLSK